MKKSAIVMALSLVLGACGGGGSDEGDSAPPDSTPAPVPTYTVQVNTNDGGTASVTREQVESGASLEITLSAESGYSLTSVEGCEGSLTDLRYTTGAISQNCTVEVRFTEQAAEVIASAQGNAGGQISPAAQTVEPGASATFTLTPDDGFYIEQAAGCEGTLEGNIFTTAALQQSCTVNVSFAESVVISSAVTGGGTVYPAQQTVAPGASVFVTMVPDATTMLSDISGCNGTLKGNIYQFTAAQSCQITGTFEPQPDTLTRANLGGQKTLIVPVSFVGRGPLEGASDDQLIDMFITQPDAINRYVVDGSAGQTWLEPAIASALEFTGTDTSGAPTSDSGLLDATVQLGADHREQIYQHIASTVENYTSYDRLITVINDNPNNPYVCYAALDTTTQDGWQHYVTHNASECVSKATLLHELGHTFGMRHTDSIACSTLPTQTLSYRSISDCPTGVAGNSVMPMGAIGQSSAMFSAVVRKQAGWLSDEQTVVVDNPATITLNQSSLPAEGVQLVRVAYAPDKSGNPLYINAELKAPVGLDASLFEGRAIESAYQLLVSVPHTRTNNVSDTLRDVVYLTQTDTSDVGITQSFTDPYRDITIELVSVQGEGETLNATLQVTPPRLMPSVNLAVLPGAAVNETITVSFSNNTDSAQTGLTTGLTGFNASHFGILASTCEGAALQPGESCDVQVQRNASSSAFAAVTVTSDQNARQQVEIEAVAINTDYDETAQLEWLSEPDYARMNVFEAVAYCEAKQDNGATNWRLPTQQEFSAAFVNTDSPALNLTVANVTRFFWSASVAGDGQSQVLQVAPQSYSIARSTQRSAIRHAACVRTL
ncbi:InlB B-repeat-containing protein [Salinimonas sediminis]|uniref:DUF1566 domain-containing protein n=1 Tax=Salinimonas sediminis TaxID=2303538 RepID=A0A346NPG2_9ALTE|nr:DUF1566 domain-containing protein [Salinimonas sediminis]AXR07419.1 DUF1566 domain-containing protein [Salinimonas sediminis]